MNYEHSKADDLMSMKASMLYTAANRDTLRDRKPYFSSLRSPSILVFSLPVLVVLSKGSIFGIEL